MKKITTNRLVLSLITFFSVLLIVGAWRKWLPLSLVEVLGFITGAFCVWLTVKENIWNWPIGIANSIFFIILFFKARLFADMGLQFVYVVLGLLGWYWWLHGGEHKTILKVSHASWKTISILTLITVLATWGMTIFLQSINDSAPFWDALTTVMSLVAQYLLTKKLIENWYVWISADIIYIGLYIYKDLFLTSILYLVFMTMCVVGLMEWNRSLKRKSAKIKPVDRLENVNV